MAVYNAISNQVLTTTGTPTFASLTLGSPLLPSSGGTGVANDLGSTITLGGALTTSGAFASTFTMTGVTNVTFPTSGTLATTSQLPTPAALTKVDDTNVTLTLGGTPSTALLQATSITAGWTGQLGLTRGGTAASLTASNGGIVYSTSSALAILSGTATANRVLVSGSSGAPSWSTATFPVTAGSAGTILRSNGTNWVNSTSTFADTYTASNLLYSNGANTVTGLATGNNGILVTNGSGVPSIGNTISGQMAIALGSFGGAGPFTALAVSATTTGANNTFTGISVSHTSTNSNTTAKGIDISITDSGGSVTPIYGVNCTVSEARASGAASTSFYGGSFTTTTPATASTASNMTYYGVVGSVNNQHTGETSTVYGGNFSGVGPSTVYGVYASATSGTTNWGVYSAAGSNYFSGVTTFNTGFTITKVNGTEASNAVTTNGYAGVITTSSLTTAAGGSYAITWTNSSITSTSVFSLCIQGGTNTRQNIQFKCAPGSGTATLTIYNNEPSNALNGTILIGYHVF